MPDTRDPDDQIELPTRDAEVPEPPGEASELLAPFLRPERLERLRTVLAQRTRHLTALVEHVHDPHNVAACMRSCDAFGIQDLHVIPPVGRSLRYASGVSIGAEKWLTIHRHRDLDAALTHLQGAGYRVVATDADEPGRDLRGATTAAEASSPAEPRLTIPLDELDVAEPLCVAFGNEHTGITDALRQRADGRLRIPMVGFAESLNISVSVAVTLYTLRRRLERTAPPTAARAPSPSEPSPPSVADVEPAWWGLATSERLRLLDRWVMRDVPRARAVLAEVRRRRGLSADERSA